MAAKSGPRTTPKTRRRESGGQPSMATSAENAVGTEADAPARGSAPPSKYDTMTVYDPATRTVRDAAGAVVAPPTLAELSAMPGDAPVLDRPYECEPADDATVALLAKVAGLTVAALEAKRRDWLTPPQDCPTRVRPNRRRCVRCPRWTETDALPF